MLFNSITFLIFLIFVEVGINLQVSTLKIILSANISFYTFQALSYSIDVYRKQIESTKNIFNDTLP